MAAPITDATGFHMPTVEEIEKDFVAEERATISPQVDTEADALVGEINGIVANAIRLLGEALVEAYNAFDPQNATFERLKVLSRVTGTVWREATYGLLDGTRRERVTLQAGTAFPIGQVVSDGSGDPQHRWVSTRALTAAQVPVDGDYLVPFRAEQPGPIPAPAGTLTTIETPLAGWTATTNPLDAVPGLPDETEEELRARRNAEIYRLGGGSAPAIDADLRDYEEEGIKVIQDLTLLVNDSDAVDFNGLAPHSIHVIIFDGLVPQADNENFAAALWNAKGAGIATNGSVLVMHEDAFGETHPVRFSRITITPFAIDFDLVTNDAYPGNTAFAQTIATASASLQRNGGDVVWSEYVALAMAVPGVERVVAVTIDAQPPNTDLTATPFVRYSLDSTDVTVT